jgi:hypothetical protein
MARLMAPTLAVPSVSAGGAVAEPEACTCMLNSGWLAFSWRAISYINSAMVTDPVEIN